VAVSAAASFAVEWVLAETPGDAAALTATVTPTSPGVYSEAVRGVNNDTGGSGIGVYGQQNGYGYGVRGTAPYGRGVYGSSSTGFGVWGTSASGYGVYGSSFSSYGVYGSSGSSYAGYFNGPVKITGGCTGCAGAALRIDHPLDPAHKYLQHSTVVSPQMKDIYDGVVTTTVNGFATVRLPRYFQALNRSFRYQLTSLSGLQEVAVAKEIAHNRFTIQSEKPRSKVSWQVTGIRHDRYANAHPIKAVVPKAKADQGKYLHPELYGKPKSAGIGYRKPPRLPSRPLQKR